MTTPIPRLSRCAVFGGLLFCSACFYKVMDLGGASPSVSQGAIEVSPNVYFVEVLAKEGISEDSVSARWTVLGKEICEQKGLVAQILDRSVFENGRSVTPIRTFHYGIENTGGDSLPPTRGATWANILMRGHIKCV